MNAAAADKYLRETWSGTAGGPTATLLGLLSRGGYFEVPHLVLTYVDYLAGLSAGNGRAHKFSDAIAFMRTYFPDAYRDVAPWLVIQYRHGLVHEYDPKVIAITGGLKLGWALVLGSENRHRHLHFVQSDARDVVLLQISGAELVTDLQAAVELFRTDITTRPDVLAKFWAGFAAYGEPETLESIDKPYITDTDRQWLQRAAQGAVRAV